MTTFRRSASAELRATIEEALAIKRYSDLASWFVFDNLSGQRYTKGGWKATLAKLMDECEAEASRRRIAFARFSLQECRPMGSRRRWSAATLTRSTRRCTVPNAWCARSTTGGVFASLSRRPDHYATGLSTEPTWRRRSATRRRRLRTAVHPYVTRGCRPMGSRLRRQVRPSRGRSTARRSQIPTHIPKFGIWMVKRVSRYRLTR